MTNPDDNNPTAKGMYRKMKEMFDSVAQSNSRDYNYPFEDRDAFMEITGLTIENNAEMITLRGELKITKDENGLRLVKQLLHEIEQIHLVLDMMKDKEELPYRLKPSQTESVCRD